MQESNDLEETGYESQTHSRIFQRPPMKDKGYASTVSLSMSRHGKVTLNLESGPRRSQGYSFWGSDSSLWAVAFHSLDSCVWGTLYSLCQHYLTWPSADLGKFPTANSIYQAVLLNKPAWHKSSAYARPPGPNFCFYLFYFSSLDTLPSMTLIPVSQWAFGRTWEYLLRCMPFVENKPNSRHRTILSEIFSFVRLFTVVVHAAIETVTPSALFGPLAVNTHACLCSRSSSVRVYLL